MGNIQSTFLSHGSELNQTFRHEELHVFVPDLSNIKESVNTFIGLYSVRTRTSKEFWMFDTTQMKMTSPNDELFDQIRSDFENLALDLDDDLFLFSGLFFLII